MGVAVLYFRPNKAHSTTQQVINFSTLIKCFFLWKNVLLEVINVKIIKVMTIKKNTKSN